MLKNSIMNENIIYQITFSEVLNLIENTEQIVKYGVNRDLSDFTKCKKPRDFLKNLYDYAHENNCGFFYAWINSEQSNPIEYKIITERENTLFPEYYIIKIRQNNPVKFKII